MFKEEIFCKVASDERYRVSDSRTSKPDVLDRIVVQASHATLPTSEFREALNISLQICIDCLKMLQFQLSF